MEQGYAVEADVISPKKKAEKKPNFIARWFFKSLKVAAEQEREEVSLKERAMVKAISAGESISTEPMRFSIYHASGGFVIETRTPNRSGRNTNTIGPESNTKLHIIHKDADLGQEIAKIITLEGLRA
jgi:hypothetical protein